MKLIKMQCTNCGGELEIDANSKETICPYCQTKMHIDDPSVLSIHNPENTGYEFEKGRLKARKEILSDDSKKAKNNMPIWLKILLWVIFLPIMLLIIIWKKKEWSNKRKIILSLVILIICSTIYKSIDFGPSKIRIPASEVYFDEWLNDNFESIKEATIVLDKSRKEATVNLYLNCIKSPLKELEEMFNGNGENIKDYYIADSTLHLNNIYLYGHDNYDAEGMRNTRNVDSLLNMKEGEQQISFTFGYDDYDYKELKDFKQLLIDVELRYELVNKNDEVDKYIFIPWNVIVNEKVAETKEEDVEEETAEETNEDEPIEEEKVEEEVEEKEEVITNGVTPSFKEQMDSYEKFFDEYIELMESVEKDPTLIASTKYLQFMMQYAETMEKLEEIDENSLSEADQLYYIEVQSRINQKLLEATAN